MKCASSAELLATFSGLSAQRRARESRRRAHIMRCLACERSVFHLRAVNQLNNAAAQGGMLCPSGPSRRRVSPLSTMACSGRGMGIGRKPHSIVVGIVCRALAINALLHIRHHRSPCTENRDGSTPRRARAGAFSKLKRKHSYFSSAACCPAGDVEEALTRPYPIKGARSTARHLDDTLPTISSGKARRKIKKGKSIGCAGKWHREKRLKAARIINITLGLERARRRESIKGRGAVGHFMSCLRGEYSVPRFGSALAARRAAPRRPGQLAFLEIRQNVGVGSNGDGDNNRRCRQESWASMNKRKNIIIMAWR